MELVVELFFASVAFLYTCIPRPFGYPVAFLAGVAAVALIVLVPAAWRDGWHAGTHAVAAFALSRDGLMFLTIGGSGTTLVTWLIIIFNPDLVELRASRRNGRL